MVTILNRENDTQDLDKILKEREYLDYINEHIQNVIMMYKEEFYPFLDPVNEDLIIPNEYFSTEEFKNAIKELSETIAEHDESKYTDEEFNPYRRHFHPTLAEEMEEDQQSQLDAFQEAWKHHYMNNPHHPQYWYDEETQTSRDMNLRSIIEMICDWDAMSYKFNQNTIEWYKTKADKEKKAMTERTRAITELILYKILKNPMHAHD
ncbi:MAG: hypothetical protein IKR19_08440 [Acholeplasmatales bacterium]|nr:hypothetical protein [Acholeplasmatales bacterium]